MSSNERVRVAVRVRPLNPTERLNGRQNIIQIHENKLNTLTIWDPIGLEALDREEFRDIDPSCWSRQFTFDHCLASSDHDEIYQSQEDIFNIIGQPVVSWALDGYNSCVFAYGQTGAGKSFTMMGTENPAEFGLIPRICFGLFEYFENVEQDNENQCTIDFSYLEIYNETLRSLSSPPFKSPLHPLDRDCLTNSAKNLKVRESPRDGTFVTNLTVIQVHTFEDILSLILTGNSHRSIASTRSNVYSSRSHAIVTLTVKQRYRELPKDGLLTSALRSKVSKIHLVDLAGSERVTNSGAVGLRLREANNINKSLSVLGDVIKSLGENSRQKTSSGHIPYRNSILTMVLKNSLGGNSRTVMVANVSPSSADYEETISTLKYADNTKKIRLRVEANVMSGLSASDGGAMQLVPVLQAEVKKLRELLQQQQLQQHKFSQASHLNPLNSSSSSIAPIDVNTVETLELVDQMRARVMELEEQLLEREELIKNLMENSSVSPSNQEDEDTMSVLTTHSSHTTGGSTIATGNRSQPFVVLADDAMDTTLPRLINLNQDPLFSECLVYYIPPGLCIAGSSEVDVDILLSGPDILSKHCGLYNDRDNVYLYPMSSTAKIYVNGLLLQQPISSRSNEQRYYLRHFDRVSMGRYHLFRFEACGRRRAVSPVKGMKASVSQLTSLNTDAPGWDFAHDELMLHKDSTMIAHRSRSPRRGDHSGQYPPGYFSSIMNAIDSNHDDPQLSSPSSMTGSSASTKTTLRTDLQSQRQITEKAKSTPQESTTTEAPSAAVTKRTPSDEWWDKVNEVVENPTKVNTPAELRAMLRSVMESAEKQFDDAFSSMKQPQSSPTASVSVSALKKTKEVQEEEEEEGEEPNNSSPPSKVMHPAPQSSHSRSLLPKKSPSDPLISDATILPPPPPPLLSTAPNSKSHQLTSNDYLFVPPPQQLDDHHQRSSSNSSLTNRRLSSKTKLPSNDTKTVDILYAERRSLTSLLISNEKEMEESSKVKQKSSRVSSSSSSEKQNGNSSHRYSAPDQLDQASHSLFEDEASALQKDMLQMQQNLRDRMQRYK